MTEYETALRRIEERSINTCPGCGQRDAKWKNPTLIGLQEINGGKLADGGPEAFAIACESCGFIRLYAVEMN